MHPRDSTHHREPDDPELIERANRGDGSAFALLYRRHRNFALRVALRMTGDPDSAADVVQDAFLWWIKQFPGFTLRSAVTTYLYTLIRSRAIDFARRRGVRLRAIDDESSGAGRSLAAMLGARGEADGGDVAGGDFAEDDALLRVMHALDRLPFAQQEVLLLRFGHDMRDEQIAEALGIPLGTVKSRLRLGLATLRTGLGHSE